MKVKALRSFAGVMNMSRGQELDIQDEYILKDLLRAGYVEAANPQTDAETAKGKLDPADLGEMHYNDVKKLAKEMGLDAGGTKEELIARICAAEVEAGEAE